MLVFQTNETAAMWLFQKNETAAMLVLRKNETAAMLMFQTSPLGVELFSYVNALFCCNKTLRSVHFGVVVVVRNEIW